ncbi:MAG TPA: hypothetical protein VEZ20_06595 [Allosphingosinicella sp.]|jgi:hypothetical protein|nr:hypothetical protein [Allosphingosinicella sp.]
MRLLLFVAFASLAGAATLAAQTAPSPAAGPVQWTIQPRSGETTGPETLQFQLTRTQGRSRWVHSDSVAPERLRGLSSEALSSAEGRPVAFRFGGEAGVLACEGVARRGHGTGECRFEPDTAFSAALARRGMGTPSDEEMFRMSIAGIGLAFVDEVQRQGYVRPTVAELVRAADHGVGLEYLRGMGRLGYRAGTLAGLTRMRDHGVTPVYVEALAAAGYRGLSSDEIVRMRDHGVSAEFVRALAQNGVRGLTSAELVRLRDHGVSAEFVGRVRALGFAATPAEMIRMRDHGVGADYLTELKTLGYGDLTPAEIVRLRSHGVSTDFIRRANAGGRRSAEELVRLRSSGS